MTQRSDSLKIVVSRNGLKDYRFETPLLERYELAREPYSEYRKGIFIENFRDSTEEIESTLLADYAINYEKRSLWEARGNVIATGADGQKLYTEQLFWDERTERIYSNVTSRVVQGNELFEGEGFESDQRFENWTFRNAEGQIEIDPTPIEEGGTEAPLEGESAEDRQAYSPTGDNTGVPGPALIPALEGGFRPDSLRGQEEVTITDPDITNP